MPRHIALIFFMLLIPTITLAQNKVKFKNIKAGMTGEYADELVWQGLQIANERAVNLRCREEYTRGVIISYGWDMDYDWDGCIIGRKIHMELYCERPDGCAIAEFLFKQKTTGHGCFSERLRFDKVGQMYRLECD